MRRPGIEPGSQEWESCMIPLHQRRCCEVPVPCKIFIQITATYLAHSEREVLNNVKSVCCKVSSFMKKRNLFKHFAKIKQKVFVYEPARLLNKRRKLKTHYFASICSLLHSRKYKIEAT
jgi:hypothetical protein